MEMKFSNVWLELPGTITAIGLVAAAVTPLFAGAMPTTAAGWSVWVVAMASAALKALGK